MLRTAVKGRAAEAIFAPKTRCLQTFCSLENSHNLINLTGLINVRNT